jgi:hypothetical protein
MQKRSGKGKSADEITGMASRGEDVSSHFTNAFTFVRPVRRVNVDLSQAMLNELDARAARLNISRQAVIKTLLDQGLRRPVLPHARARSTDAVRFRMSPPGPFASSTP